MQPYTFRLWIHARETSLRIGHGTFGFDAESDAAAIDHVKTTWPEKLIDPLCGEVYDLNGGLVWESRADCGPPERVITPNDGSL